MRRGLILSVKDTWLRSHFEAEGGDQEPHDRLGQIVKDRSLSGR